MGWKLKIPNINKLWVKWSWNGKTHNIYSFWGKIGPKTFWNAARIDSGFQIRNFSAEIFFLTIEDINLSFSDNIYIIILKTMTHAFYIRVKMFWLRLIFPKRTRSEDILRHNPENNYRFEKIMCHCLSNILIQ